MKRALPDVAATSRELSRLQQRLIGAVSRSQGERVLRLAALANSLGHLDPTQVLRRGYSIVRDAEGHVVVSGKALAPRQALDLTFAEGGAAVTVREAR